MDDIYKYLLLAVGLFTCIIVAFALPVQALTLADGVLYFDDSPLETIAPNKDVSVTFQFVASGECSDCRVFFDFSSFHPDIDQSSILVQTKECPTTEDGAEGTRECSIPLRLKITGEDNSEGSLSYTYQVVGEGSFNGGVQLTIDDTIPILKSITTNFCQENRCFVGSNTPTLITALFEDSLTSFEKKLVRFSVGGASASATSCEGKQCSAIVETRFCVDGSEVPIGVTDFYATIPSSEDALNPVQTSVVQSAICDAQAPQVSDFKISSVTPIFQERDPVVFSATAKDLPKGAVSIVINVSDNESVVSRCAESQRGDAEDEPETENVGVYDCSAQLQLSAGTHNIKITIKDGVGNSWRTSETVTVRESSDEQVDLLVARTNKITPNPINRVAVDLAVQNAIDYPVLVDYTLAKKRSDADISYQKIKSCSLIANRPGTGANSGSQDSNTPINNIFARDRSYVLDPLGKPDEENRLVLNLAVRPDSLPDRAVITCTLEVSVLDSRTFYSEPEEENITFTLEFANAVLDTPGKAFTDEIKRAESGVSGDFNKMMQGLRQAGATADTVCSVYGMMVQMQVGGSLLESVGLALGPLGGPVAAAGSAMYVPATVAVETNGNDKSAEIVIGTAGSKLNEIKESGEKISNDAKEEIAGTVSEVQDIADGNILANACNWWNCVGAEKEKGLLGGNACEGINSWWDEGDIVTNTVEGEERPVIAGPPEDSAFANSYAIRETYETTSSLSDLSGTTNICAPNYEESLLASLGVWGGSMCIKGVMYNLGKWQANSCGYVSCLKEQSLNGASVALCKEAKRSKECQFIIGEVYELPYANAFTNTFAQLNAQVQDAPLEILNSFTSRACAPGTESVKDVANQIGEEIGNIAIETAFNAGNAATSGALGVSRTLLSLLSKVTQAQKVAHILDLSAGVGRPASPAEPQNLVCHLLNAAYRTGHLAEVKNQGVSGIPQFNAQYDICQAALCNEAEQINGVCPERSASVIKLPSLGGVNLDRELATATRQFTAQEPSITYEEHLRGFCDNRNPKCTVETYPDGSMKIKVEGGEEVDLPSTDEIKEQQEEYIKRIVAERRNALLADIGIRYLAEKGYLENLQLSGLGDWGAQRAAEANKYLNPEQWKVNLCSEVINIDDDYGVVPDLARTKSPVLTFSAEKRVIDAETAEVINSAADEYTIYVVSWFVRSDQENTVRFVFKPGNVEIINGSINSTATTSGYILQPQEDYTSPRSESAFVDDRVFTEFCAVFGNGFPGRADKKEYCRPIVSDAYDRGSSS